MNRIVLKGPAGDVRWSYRQAASVGPWTLTSDPSATTLTATVVRVDPFAVGQAPLTFVVQREKGEPWRWAIETMTIADGTLTATLRSA